MRMAGVVDKIPFQIGDKQSEDGRGTLSSRGRPLQAGAVHQWLQPGRVQ